jgi:hypothetical protein
MKQSPVLYAVVKHEHQHGNDHSVSRHHNILDTTVDTACRSVDTTLPETCAAAMEEAHSFTCAMITHKMLGRLGVSGSHERMPLCHRVACLQCKTTCGVAVLITVVLQVLLWGSLR